MRFMSHRDGIKYSQSATIDKDAAYAVTPEDICRYFNFIAYGKEEPTSTDFPILARSSTLEFYKKAISSFMPHRMVVWDDRRRDGNPTRSIQVNNLIKAVKKCEVRQQGVKTSARRPLEYIEFIALLTFVRQDQSIMSCHRLVAVLLTQWQLIGRIDDMLKLKYANLSYNAQNNFTVLAQLRWSKNITEERDAPEQILLGSMDERLCVLLNLGIYIEMHQETAGKDLTVDDFIFENGSADRSVRASLTKAISNESLATVHHGPLGTHSVRKGAATYASRNGVTKDFVKLRGRWRTKSGAVDRYIDPMQPYPDVITSATLAGPSGPAKYQKKPGVFYLSEAFLLEHVAPGIAKVLGRQLAATFALPMLWAAQSTSSFSERIVPTAYKERVLSAIVRVGGDPADIVVERVPIHVSGEGGMANFVELGKFGDGQDGATTTIGCELAGPGALMRETVSVNAQVASLRRRIEEHHVNVLGEITRLRADTMARLENMHRSVNRITLQPVTRSVRDDSTVTVQSSGRARVKLSKCPRDLYVLWHEYEFGQGGLKPAKASLHANVALAKPRTGGERCSGTLSALWCDVAARVMLLLTKSTACTGVVVV